MENLNIKPSVELAYWTGVVQSDGCLTRYVKTDKVPSEITLGVCRKSLPMLKKFREISFDVFNRHSNLWKTKGRNEWRFHIGVKKLLTNFERLDIIFGKFIPPKWCINRTEFFGSYLAGLIDGDGDVRVKRPEYPQCVIRLTSGMRQNLLSFHINQILKCSVYESKHHHRKFFKSMGRVIEGNSNTLEFYVSNKNLQFISNFVIPKMNLKYKKRMLENFIRKKIGHAPAGI